MWGTKRGKISKAKSALKVTEITVHQGQVKAASRTK